VGIYRRCAAEFDGKRAEAIHGNHVPGEIALQVSHTIIIHHFLVFSSPSLPTMFRKSLAKTVPSSTLLRPQRSFSTTSPARKLVASNPVKAQEVKVSHHRSPNSPFLTGPPFPVLVFRKISAH
jgi:hypothetical protein